jgi:hypothetical protein
MTGTDLIVLAPWIVFIAGLAVICVLLLHSRRASGSRPQRPPRSARSARSARDARDARDAPASRELASRPDPQETRCRENNAEATPQ